VQPPPPTCQPTGSAEYADNARSFDLTAPVVAIFRDSATSSETCRPCQEDIDCDDDVFCNGAEICVAGVCQPGTMPTCDDFVGCTDDSCDTATDSCVNTPVDALCDNSLYCDGVETCNPTVGCEPDLPVDCNDGVPCTDDSCNEATDECDHIPDDADCSNDLFCDGAEICNPDSGCKTGLPEDCLDFVECTLDSCNEDSDECDHEPDHLACDNGDFCDGFEVCDPVKGCVGGPPQDCDDGIACTDDSCKGEACQHRDNCPGGQACREASGECMRACQTEADCEDGIDCTFDKCLFDLMQPETGFCKRVNHCY